MTTKLEICDNDKQKNDKLFIGNFFKELKNEHIQKLIEIIKSQRRLESKQDLNQNTKLIEYLERERLILDEDLRKRADQIKKMGLDIETNEIERESEESRDQTQFGEEDSEDDAFLEPILEEQLQMVEMLEQFKTKNQKNEIKLQEKEDEMQKLERELEKVKTEFNRVEEANREWKKKETQKQALISEYRGKAGHISDDQEVSEFLQEIHNLKAELARAESELTNEKAKSAKVLQERSHQETFLKECKYKNEELRKRVCILNQLWAGKVKDIAMLITENTKLRKEVYMLQGDYRDPMDIFAGDAKSGSGLYFEVENVMAKNAELEKRLMELEIVRTRREKNQTQRTAKREHRMANLPIEPPNPKLKKVNFGQNPFFKKQEKKFAIPVEKAKQSVEMKSGPTEIEKKNNPLNKEIEALIQDNLESKNQIKELESKNTELTKKMQILEQLKEKPKVIEANKIDSNELLVRLEELVKIEREKQEMILRRQESNLNKFIRQLEIKVELLGQQKSSTADSKATGSQAGEPRVPGTSGLRAPESTKLMRNEEFFSLLEAGRKGGQVNWATLERVYSKRAQLFDDDPIKQLSEREIFFIDSPYFFLNRLLQENTRLLLELKEVETKTKVIVENDFLRNVMKENNKMNQKLDEFRHEKAEIDAIKEQIREVYGQIRGDEQADVSRMTEYLAGLIRQNEQMKRELIEEKKAKLGKIVWNVEVMRRRLKIQEKGRILDDLHKKMEDKLRMVETKLNALELVVMEDMDSEADKQLKKDALAQLIEALREDLVKRVEEGMKAVTKYFQQVMQDGSDWQKEAQFKELQAKQVALESEMSQQKLLASNLQEEVNRLEQDREKAEAKIDSLVQRKDTLKGHLILFKREKEEATQFVKAARESQKKVEIEGMEETISVRSENWTQSSVSQGKLQEKKFLSLLTKYQALLVAHAKNN